METQFEVRSKYFKIFKRVYFTYAAELLYRIDKKQESTFIYCLLKLKRKNPYIFKLFLDDNFKRCTFSPFCDKTTINLATKLFCGKKVSDTDIVKKALMATIIFNNANLFNAFVDNNQIDHITEETTDANIEFFLSEFGKINPMLRGLENPKSRCLPIKAYAGSVNMFINNCGNQYSNTMNLPKHERGTIKVIQVFNSKKVIDWLRSFIPPQPLRDQKATGSNSHSDSSRKRTLAVNGSFSNHSRSTKPLASRTESKESIPHSEQAFFKLTNPRSDGNVFCGQRLPPFASYIYIRFLSLYWHSLMSWDFAYMGQGAIHGCMSLLPYAEVQKLLSRRHKDELDRKFTKCKSEEKDCGQKGSTRKTSKSMKVAKASKDHFAKKKNKVESRIFAWSKLAKYKQKNVLKFSEQVLLSIQSKLKDIKNNTASVERRDGPPVKREKMKIQYKNLIGELESHGIPVLHLIQIEHMLCEFRKIFVQEGIEMTRQENLDNVTKDLFERKNRKKISKNPKHLKGAKLKSILEEEKNYGEIKEKIELKYYSNDGKRDSNFGSKFKTVEELYKKAFSEHRNDPFVSYIERNIELAS